MWTLLCRRSWQELPVGFAGGESISLVTRPSFSSVQTNHWGFYFAVIITSPTILTFPITLHLPPITASQQTFPGQIVHSSWTFLQSDGGWEPWGVAETNECACCGCCFCCRCRCIDQQLLQPERRYVSGHSAQTFCLTYQRGVFQRCCVCEIQMISFIIVGGTNVAPGRTWGVGTSRAGSDITEVSLVYEGSQSSMSWLRTGSKLKKSFGWEAKHNLTCLPF